MKPEPTNRLIPFLTLVEKEFYRFFRLSGQTLAPPIIMTVLFIIIFGYSLGTRISEISGFSYIHYILPGLAGMGIINNAYANTITSLFMARTDRSIENILVAPVSYLRIVTSFALAGTTRGLLVGVTTFVVAMPLTQLPIHSPVITLLMIFVIGLFFAAVGIIAALWAESWDHIATTANFIITPLVYLGGVFYSIAMLPPTWQKVSLANPLFYMIDALRWAVLGHSDIDPRLSLGVTGALTVVMFSIAVYLFRRGYKLIV